MVTQSLSRVARAPDDNNPLAVASLVSFGNQGRGFSGVKKLGLGTGLGDSLGSSETDPLFLSREIATSNENNRHGLRACGRGRYGCYNLIIPSGWITGEAMSGFELTPRRTESVCPIAICKEVGCIN